MNIGIVLPSRNRPEGCRRMVESLLDNASKPDRVEVYVGLDDDDPQYGAYADIPGCELIVRRPCLTVAKTIDNLSAIAEEETDAVIRMDDDFICESRGWDDDAEAMTGLGLWLPDDPTHPGHFMSFSAMSSEMARWLREQQGFVHAPWFPFWFTDTWLNEIADMASTKGVLNMKISQPDGRGKTHGLRDIVFWTRFFESFRVHRAELAAALIREGYPDGVLKRTALMKLPERKSLCELVLAPIKDRENIASFEAKAEAFEGTSNERYLAARAEAQKVIEQARAA